ncbi:unnamed protein product, partial [Brenthis ino]
MNMPWRRSGHDRTRCDSFGKPPKVVGDSCQSCEIRQFSGSGYNSSTISTSMLPLLPPIKRSSAHEPGTSSEQNQCLLGAASIEDLFDDFLVALGGAHIPTCPV